MPSVIASWMFIVPVYILYLLLPILHSYVSLMFHSFVTSLDLGKLTGHRHSTQAVVIWYV